jgi:hypothetical protein
MKIRFVQPPKGGRSFKVGDEAEFNGPIEEGYARKYIARGWAIDVTNERPARAVKPEVVKTDSVKTTDKPASTQPVVVIKE